MEYGSEWTYNDIDACAFRKHAFQAQHQYHYSLSEKSIHTLENKVLMHQCAIAQRISKQKASPIPPQKGRANQQLEFLATKV